MFTVGETVTIKVKNALWNIRHRYASGVVGPEFQEYTGVIVDQPWFGDDIGITSNVRGVPVRRINKNSIVSVNNAEFSSAPTTTVERIVVKGSKNNTYIVTKENGKVTCSCPGFGFRKTCKHVSEIS